MNDNLKNLKQEQSINSLSISDEEKFKQAKLHIKQVMKGKKINRVIFINPPDVDEKIFDYDVAKRGRANNYPSYGLGILATQLRKTQFDVEICNLNHEVLKQVHLSKSKEDFKFLDTWHKIIIKEIIILH
mgnify:CR=1 FL=1